MKIIKLVLFQCLLICSFLVHGQDTLSKREKRVRIGEVSVAGGLISKIEFQGYEDAPSNIIPVTSFVDQHCAIINNLDYLGKKYFSVLLGIHFANKRGVEQKYLVLRLGMGYYAGNFSGNSLIAEARNTYDSIVDAETGNLFFNDSVMYRNIDYKYTYNQLRFDGALFIRINPDSRWMLYGGLGFTAGISVNSNVDLSTHQYLATEKRLMDSYSSEIAKNDVSFNNEAYKVGNKFVRSVYVPVGVNFRIGNNRYKNSHLFYEFRSGFDFTNHEQKPNSTLNLSHALGMKITF